MKRKFQILLTVSTLVIFQVGILLFTYLAKNYIEKEVIEQASNDNKVIGLQMITLLKKTGLNQNYTEIDSLLQHICDEIKLPNGGFICAVDSLGNLVAGPGLKPGMSMPFTPVFSQFENSNPILLNKLNPEGVFSGFANFRKEGRIDVVASLSINNNLRLFVHQNQKIIKESSVKYVNTLLIIGLIISLIAGLIVFFSTNRLVYNYESQIENQNQKLSLALQVTEEKQQEILAKNNELAEQRNAVKLQHDQLVNIHKDIEDSIKYAVRIQHATLPKGEFDKQTIADHFILFIPRDNVSGDFYWHHDFGDYLVVVATDCTGHGVPGAFMSMLGISFLNEILLDKKIKNAAFALDLMRENVIQALDQSYGNGGASDGMDMTICIIDKVQRTMQFAGANNPMICIRDNEIVEIKGDRMPVGIYGKMNDHFTNHHMVIKQNDVIYLFTDGYTDQFGGTKGRKFMYKNFKTLLLEIEGIDMESQKQILSETLKKWKGNYQQVDDILVIGLKIN